MPIKSLAQAAFHKLGYALYKRDCRFYPEITAKHLCSKLQLTTILDVGANTGQYAQSLREFGYAGRILSFEPLTSAHSTLSNNAKGDTRWDIAPRCAVGGEKASSEINIAANSVSSSVLSMLDSHTEVAPDSAYISKENVKIETLASLVESLGNNTETFYLKIDTQGYEKKVICGAEAILSRIPAIQMELSVSPLYEQSLLLEEGTALMKQLGYKVYSVYPGLTNRETGETLQVDIVFVRN